jgi:hypothetical protein
MLALGDDNPFDALSSHGVETHGEKKTVGVDDLDLLPHAGPERAGEVAGVGADDDRTPAFTLGKKRRQVWG